MQKGHPKIPGFRSQERARMMSNMTRALLSLERIETTHTRGKNLKQWMEQLVSAAKRYRNPHVRIDERKRAKIIVLSRLGLQGDPEYDQHLAWTSLFEKYVPRYALRHGGHVRAIRSRRRIRDDIQMTWIEFVDRPGEFRQARPPTPVRRFLERKQVEAFLNQRKRSGEAREVEHLVEE